MTVQDSGGETGSGSLLSRLVYLTAFRLLLVTALLGATLWVTLRPGDELDGPTALLLYGTIAFVYGASLGYLWLLRLRRRLQAVAYAQVAGDICLATFLVYLTGGADSLFTLMYPLAIVNASIILHRRGAVVAAVAAAVTFAALVGLLDQKLLAPAATYLAQRSVSGARLTLVVLANGVAFVLTAALASYLTEQLRRTGEQLSERELDYEALAELHGSIVNSMSSAILTTDAAGSVVFANPSAARMTGYTTQQLTRTPLAELLPELAEYLASTSDGVVPRLESELSVRDAQGRPLWLNVVVTALERQGDRGRRGSFSVEPTRLVVMENRTALRAMAEAVRRSDRLAAVGELAAGLAHELRNPLGSMSGAVELLSKGASLTDAERRLFDIVFRETARLNRLVTDFLSFARPLPVTTSPTDVAALADETLNVFKHGPFASNLQLERVGADSLRVFADTAQLRQVVWNLLQNAAEAMSGRGGRITVEVDWTPEGMCRLAVTDTGAGIDAEGLARLFEPFYTTKESGTGLGLASVHRIVEAHLGSVEVTSEVGRGTTVAILLPVQAPGDMRAA